MATSQFGDGTPAPPALAGSIIEQQRAANKIARLLRERLSTSLHFRIEAQFTVSTTRLVIHYGTQLNDTVELDYTVGDPLDDPGWLLDMAKLILHTVSEGESDFFIARELDHYNIMDEDGCCIFEFGRAYESRAS